MRDDVSALYVRADGPYPTLVADWWDEERDARLYDGANPVVAHPPCARWSMLAGLVEARYGYKIGDDGGCFAAALANVRRCGGVLEHPAESSAWPAHGLLRPSSDGWTGSLLRPDEWTTEVSQQNYGHRARKRTWLLYVGAKPPPLDWTPPTGQAAYLTAPRLGRRVYGGPGELTSGELRRQHNVELMGKRERSLTPLPFAELLVEMAASARK